MAGAENFPQFADNPRTTPAARGRLADRPARARAALVARGERARRVVVVGDEEFCERFTVDRRSRVAARWVLPGPHDVGDPPALPVCDELLVDGRSFAALRQSAPHVFDIGRIVRVAPGGVVDDSVLSHPLTTPERVFKRALDIVVAVALLVLTLPLVLVAALAVKLDSPGPVLFRHVRLGAGGRRFQCLKLRTMTVADDDEQHRAYVADMIRSHAPPENGLFKLASNRRITRSGRLLRRFSIDELPQLWNVLKGEMSIVGPRPPILYEAEVYGELDWQRLRMKPGLTGLAQIRGRSGLRFDQILAADMEYCCSWSPLLELKILLHTPSAVLTGRGAV